MLDVQSRLSGYCDLVHDIAKDLVGISTKSFSMLSARAACVLCVIIQRLRVMMAGGRL